MRSTIEKDDYVEFVYAPDPRYDSRLADEDGVQEVQESRSFTECFFIDRDYHVQTLSDSDETVLAFSVTTRHRRFKPRFEMPFGMNRAARRRWRKQTGEPYRPLFRIQLGHTRFDQLGPVDPDDFAGPSLSISVGARNFSYSEFNYYGNPGNYQTYVFTVSSAARAGALGEVMATATEIERERWPGPFDDPDPRDWDDLTTTHTFRKQTAITTYTVIGPALADRNYPSSFGPHGDEVRTLP